MTERPSGSPAPERVTASLAVQASSLAERPLISVPRAHFRRGWSARHILAGILLAPVLGGAFRAAAGNPPWQDVPWTVAVVALSALGTLVAVTYVPVRGSARTGTSATGASPCAAVAGVHVVAATMLLGLIPALPMAGLALAIETFALYQRTSGACGTG